MTVARLRGMRYSTTEIRQEATAAYAMVKGAHRSASGDFRGVPVTHLPNELHDQIHCITAVVPKTASALLLGGIPKWVD